MLPPWSRIVWPGLECDNIICLKSSRAWEVFFFHNNITHSMWAIVMPYHGHCTCQVVFRIPKSVLKNRPLVSTSCFLWRKLDDGGGSNPKNKIVWVPLKGSNTQVANLGASYRFFLTVTVRMTFSSFLVSENDIFLTLGSGTSNARNENLRPLLKTNIPIISGKFGLRNHFLPL